jgi:hypothetical protein
VVVEDAADGSYQFPGGAETAAPDALFAESGEPALDEVEPTGGGGREVNMKARAFDNSALDGRGFVSGLGGLAFQGPRDDRFDLRVADPLPAFLWRSW